MSTYQHDWAILDDNGSNTGVGVVSVSPTSVNWGRIGRYETYFYINGSNERCEIEVSQNGHEFVDANDSIAEIQYNESDIFLSFYTNSQYLELALSGRDNDKFSITRVYYTVPGNNTPVDFNDWSGQMEPTGDPGQDERYLVSVVLSTGVNAGTTDKKCTLTLTGSSNTGINQYSDSTDIVQHCES